MKCTNLVDRYIYMDESYLFEDDDLFEVDWCPKEVAANMKRLIIKTYYNKNEILEEVVCIIDEYIAESGYALSKEILVWLNEQYKKD